MRKLVASLCSAVLLSGCGTIFKDRSQEPVSPIGGFGTPAGSPPSTPPNGITSTRWRNADRVTIDLPSLIALYAQPPGSNATFERALAAFSQTDMTPAARKRARNDIVGAVMMASEKNCQVYVEYLHGNQAAVKGTFSVASTLLSGAAGVTSPVRSSQLLAGLATAATGVGSNLSEALFNSKTADVIVSGIEAERATLKAKMRDDMKLEYDDYPLMMALTDAATYHSRCNAISGLAYLQASAQNTKAVAETGNPAGGAGAAAKTTTTTTATPTATTTTTTTPAAGATAPAH